MRNSTAIESLLAPYSPELRDLAAAARKFVSRALPGAVETVDSSAKLFGYGYGPGYKGAICTLLLSKTGIKLGMSRGAELPDPQHLMQGSGNVHRHVQLRTNEDLKRPGLKQLLQAAVEARKTRNSNDSDPGRPQKPSVKRAATAKPRESDKTQIDAEVQLASFIEKFEPRYGQLIKGCRKALKRILPTAVELVYDNYNFFVIGYCSSERPSDCIVSIAAAANGVGLSFYRGADLPDPAGILQGTGKQNRFIRLPTAGKLGEPDVLALIHAAAAHGKTKLPSSGSGNLIIKSVSAKQRPRQRATGRSDE